MILLRLPTLFLLLVPLSLLVLPTSYAHAYRLGERSFSQLSSAQIAQLINTPDPLKNLDWKDPQSHLSKILIPRVSDTPNNTLVQQYITSTLRALPGHKSWHIQLDSFEDTTPFGLKRFTNIIATKDPHASRKVVLAAHFDSKWFQSPADTFLGATDSALPCALLLDLAQTLDPLLDARAKRVEDDIEGAEDEDVADTTLQLVFFDGEEAFVQWTEKDSIYGARHLAESWSQPISPLSDSDASNPNSNPDSSSSSSNSNEQRKRRLLGPQSLSTPLSQIEHLILLDLLGAPNPLIKNYFKDTAWLFDALASTERRLGESDAFAFTYGGESTYGGGDSKSGGELKAGKDSEMAAGKWTSWFRKRAGEPVNIGYMGDDHVPFLRRGVPVLHLIADPFPAVWHTMKDDASALDYPTMRRWNVLLRVFMAEYLDLRPEEGGKGSSRGLQAEMKEVEAEADREEEEGEPETVTRSVEEL